MKTAIIYYSMSGNVEMVAHKIAEEIGADILRLVPTEAYPNKGFKKFLWGGKSALMGEKPMLEPYIFNSENYDHIVIGTPVWASTFTPPIRTFVEENPEIKLKKISVFTCLSGSGAKKALEKMKKEIGIKAFENELVLIDPKQKPKLENDAKIGAFCRALTK